VSLDPPLILYDDHCRLCRAVIGFAEDRDRGRTLHFVARDSDTARSLLGVVDPSKSTPDSVIWLEGGRVLDRSDAVLEALGRLPAPWRWLAGLRVIPVGVRDAVYDWVAANRLRWFGTV
jgi:predicted DCC family thiol-disulfide oxidoreductase YuxK